MKCALAAVAVLAALSAACGGIEREPDLAQAVERTEAEGSNRLEATARIAEAGRELTLRCEGAFDYARQRFHLACTEPPAASYETLVVDGTTYMKGLVGGSEKWIKLGRADDLLDGFSPAELFELLRSASRQTERVGEEEVRGEPTTRYRMIVTCEEAELDCAGTAPADIWIDGVGRVRRIVVDDGAWAGTLEFFDFGVPVDIEPPPTDQIREPPLPDPPEECVPGDGRPIRVEQALAVLRGHGFDVTRDERSCSEGVAATVSWDGDDRGRGLLHCFVLSGKGTNPFVTGVSVTGSLPPIERKLENLECTLVLEEEQGDGPLERLDAALAELKRDIRP